MGRAFTWRQAVRSAGANVLALAMLLAPARAGADEPKGFTFLSPGPSFAYSPGADRWGAGVELSAGRIWLGGDVMPWAGAVYRGTTFGPTEGFARYTAAAEGGVAFGPLGLGLEAGLGIRRRLGSATGIHLGPHLDVYSLLVVGPEILIPTGGESRTPSVELVASLKLGALVHVLAHGLDDGKGHHRFIGAR